MNAQYEGYKKLIEDYLSGLFQDDSVISSAMRYSLLTGGKRLRPVLTLAFCELAGGRAKDALPFACALELIHTYSLIHDDLPCMDNDDTRRGKPTNHKVYGDDMALLAGDGLLTYAFEVMHTSTLPPDIVLNAARCVGTSAFDMVRGQAMDIRKDPDARLMKELKTGALFSACAKAGCTAAGAKQDELEAADKCARALGLAFQYRDDMLDNEADCQEKVVQLTNEAKNALSVFENNSFLCGLADWMCGRSF